MSTQLFSHNGIQVDQYAGPELPDDDRRRFAIVNLESGVQISVSMAQWRTLAEFFTADCDGDCGSCGSPRLTHPIPDTWKWFDE